MEWYFKELFRDRRFKIAGGICLGSLVAIIICAIIAAPWSYRLAAFGFFPLFVLAIFGVFGVLGLIVRDDMRQRQGRR